MVLAALQASAGRPAARPCSAIQRAAVSARWRAASCSRGSILLAAFATHGLCEALFQACLVGHELVTSEHILDEFQRNLTGKFRIPVRRAGELPASRASAPADVEDLPVIWDRCRRPVRHARHR